MKTKSRHHLKGSDARRIIARIEPLLEDSSRLRKSSLEMAVSDEGVDLIFVDGRPLLMMVDDQPFFTVLGAIELAPKEFSLLLALLRARGAVVSRLQLMREVWGYSAAVVSRTVDTHIAELRRKLEENPAAPRHILTIRKTGYRLKP